ncbi:MAG: hypothetical protein AYP45_05665 [Candidatus Brocadia carolinensis]|uniref:Uncharacterized protein n=1 Tax=Candidatus Brocadia carolinensis TaxID=1004156 RepID=A0A1V4AVE0_9BACT|nr:MAG: hypothetical protein AYP45_05665 [Candidatus Brocadia caroliniensis]
MGNKFSSPGCKPILRFPDWWIAPGLGIVWMVHAQDNGERILQPYIGAKCGSTFLSCSARPASCNPITTEIDRLTGESIFHGFIRPN